MPSASDRTAMLVNNLLPAMLRQAYLMSCVNGSQKYDVLILLRFSVVRRLQHCHGGSVVFRLWRVLCVKRLTDPGSNMFRRSYIAAATSASRDFSAGGGMSGAPEN